MDGLKMLAQWIGENIVKPTVRVVLVLLVIIVAGTVWQTRAQLQQSGGGGSNASVGATGAAPPSSATLAGGSVTTAAPTYTTGQMSALSLDTSGGLRLSSGSTIGITANSSVNVAQINGVTPLMGNGVSGTGAQRVTIASDSTGQIRTSPQTSCGTTVFDSAITTIPTVEAAATATSTCVQAIYVNNLTASAQTFSIKDNAATPIVIVNAFSLPANSNMLITFGGIKFNLGVRWVATNASAVNAQILGYQ